jgi:YVTN family beta-propeller protein
MRSIMLGGLIGSAVVLALMASPASAETVRVYVTNSAGDNVHVVDPATNKVVQVIEGVEAPHGVDFSPDGTRVYLSNEADSTLDVVDRESGKVVKKVPLSGHPNNIAVSKDRIFVCIAEDKGGVDVIDAASLTLAKTIPTAGRMHNVYVTPDGKHAVAGSVRKKFMIAIDVATEQVIWQLYFDQGVRPMTIEAAPDGSTSRIFVQLSNLNGFAVVDFAAQNEVARIKLPDQPTGFGVEEGRTDTPSHGMGVAPDGKSLWVTSVFANAVFIYALPELKLVGHVPLPELRLEGRAPIGALPNWVTFTPDGKFLYVSNSGTRSVSVVDTQSRKVVDVVPVGEVPKRINTLALK